MTSRITAALQAAKHERRAALIAYLCAGDPSLEKTEERVLALADAGADIVELGMPFSDPSADGPSIQRASTRALASGTKLAGVFSLVERVRRRTEVPIVLFGYYNPLHGREREIAMRAASVGIDGLLVVDLPPEESEPLRRPVVEQELDWIPLVAPTSTDARIDAAGAAATSFVYVISVAGVTGSSRAPLGAAAARARAIGERVGKEVALGFGIKTPDDVKAVSSQVAAVVVGSALVDAFHEGGTQEGVALAASLRQSTGW